MSGILLAGIDQSTTAILTKLLKTEGYKVAAATDTQQIQEKLSADKYDLVLASAEGSADPETDILKKICEYNPSTPVIVLIDDSEAETMDLISEVTPFACFQKPLRIDQLMSTVQRAVDFQGLLDSDSVNLNLQLESSCKFDGIVAESPKMKSVCEMISRVAGTDVTVLVSGEKGTGKSLVAKTLHQFSRRKDKDLVIIDCTKPGVEDDLFREEGAPSALDRSAGGTLYLRQFESMDVELQEKLAGILDSKKFKSAEQGKDRLLDARVIASGSGNLEELAAAGELSLALYKLIKVIVIKIPPLRERIEDVVPTLRMSMQNSIEEKGGVLPNMDQEVVDLLEKYPWPGNSKEIAMVADHALGAQQNGTVSTDSLPPQIRSLAR